MGVILKRNQGIDKGINKGVLNKMGEKSWKFSVFGFLCVFSALPSGFTEKDLIVTEISSMRPLTCDHGPIQTNVALRHELRSGKFWRLGLADDMNTCIQLCCEKDDCEMAFMPGLHCYGVDCFSEKHCEVTGVKPINMTVKIATVRPIVENPGMGQIVDVEDPSTKKELHCTHSPILKNVTLRGGVKAGKFSDMGEVAGMHMCTALCCERKSCDLAFMIGDTCIAVDCYGEELCQAVRARPTSYNPQLAYIRRRELQSALRKANVLPEVPVRAHEIISDRLPHMTILKTSTCSAVKIHTNVTLLGGIKSGNFTALGRAKNMQECIGKSCDLKTGDLAFMLGRDCYSITCYSERQCQTIPAQPSRFLPKIAFLKWAPKENETESLLEDHKHRHIPRCTRSHILYNHTVQGGLRAGNFTKIAEVDSIETCAALCCAEQTCDLALMLGDNCYAGDCASRELCKPIPAYHKSQIAYITSRKRIENKIDWSLWYLIVGSIAIGIGALGIAWTVCTCWQRSRKLRPKQEEADRFSMMDNYGDSVRSMHMYPQGKYINNGPLFLSDTESDSEEELEAPPLSRKTLQGPATLNMFPTNGNHPNYGLPQQADYSKARRAMQNL